MQYRILGSIEVEERYVMVYSPFTGFHVHFKTLLSRKGVGHCSCMQLPQELVLQPKVPPLSVLQAK